MKRARRTLDLRSNREDWHHSIFDSLRSYYFSLNAEDRKEAIQALAEMNDPDAARELIAIFKESQWRMTRLEILRALSKYPTQRSLEFLFSIARQFQDLPMAEAAIQSLGSTHHPQSARFLVNYYRNSPEALKPALVSALGEIPDRTLLPVFLKDLVVAFRQNQTLFTRNLALTLGELQAREALPFLEEMVVHSEQQELVLSALVSIGKIARSPFMLNQLEDRFRYHPLELQIFCGVKTQVHLRSQWKLEDYLKRLFENSEVPRGLPYELNQFNPSEVLEGLKIFNLSAYFKRMCLVLSKLDFQEMDKWYQALFDFEKLNPLEACLVLESVSAHFNPSMTSVIRAFQQQALSDPDSLLFKKWLDAMALSLPEAGQEFDALLQLEAYSEFSDSQKIQVINALTNVGLMVQMDSKSRLNVNKILERELLFETSPLVQARIIRALGALRATSRKLQDWVLESILHPLLTTSCLYYLEQCPNERDGVEALEKVLLEKNYWRGVAVPLLKAMRECSYFPVNPILINSFLQSCLSIESSQEEKLAALQFLSHHPFREFLKSVFSFLHGDPRLQFAAVLALKNFQDESVTHELIPFLKSQDPSIFGCTLDTLTKQPGVHAKRLLIDTLRNHADDLKVCDKVIRTLEGERTFHEYFIKVIEEVLESNPTHPRMEELLGLKEQWLLAGKNQPERTQAQGTEIQQIDSELSKQIKSYSQYAEVIKATLRSAEIPLAHPELFDECVDKSSIILAYCKAVDLVLEQVLGKRRLTPLLESHLHFFQNFLYTVSLNEFGVQSERILQNLALEKYFTPESLPLYKMQLIAQGILNGQILDSDFKVLDGLRAWAVIQLLYCREIRGLKPLIPVAKEKSELIIQLSKKLLSLQELRNAVAHRKMVRDSGQVDEVRKVVFEILNQIAEVYL